MNRCIFILYPNPEDDDDNEEEHVVAFIFMIRVVRYIMSRIFVCIKCDAMIAQGGSLANTVVS